MINKILPGGSWFFSIVIFSGIVLFIPAASKGQSAFTGLANLFTTPASYIVRHTGTAPVIDGDIDDEAWKQAQWTDEFRDIEGDSKPRPYLQTRVKMLWDDSCLYIAAWMQEPNVWAYLKQHDEIVYHDNDFEVFINPNNTTHQYYELEVNALNTIFDLFMNAPYRDYGSAMISWDAAGLRSATKIQGTINDPSDTDKGWTVEMAIPFKALSIGNYVQVPQEGTLWRINFSRVEWDTNASSGKYIKAKNEEGRVKPEHNWTWSAQGVKDMHFPERWGYLQFSKNFTDINPFVLPYNEQQRRYLWLIYYHEHQYFREHKVYAPDLGQIGLESKVEVDGKQNTLKLEATPHSFLGLINDENDKKIWAIDQYGWLHQIN